MFGAGSNVWPCPAPTHARMDRTSWEGKQTKRIKYIFCEKKARKESELRTAFFYSRVHKRGGSVKTLRYFLVMEHGAR